ncbi:nucleoid occlusion factor SlmA [Halieaceae bacterium IMCC8485]|uniref:Nucleoid occlusion factor SlmA n=1 Tax=Candidatus Seongchinamella marina TaxID=2518990 RepID=A0ABT3SUV7_9GAMM|nr:nucleoid occlusion factor SlmA [Candidatus Seongchinamella marina]MCX2973767.1 nucleoid occlusion factor SlmA [Candidatus Seongchinamella marina]
MPPRKSQRRQQILEALAQMLEANPGNRITTAGLAKQVGVSEAALYRHFPSKSKMFEGLIEFIEETLFSRIKLILNEEPSATGRCEKMLTLLLAFAERNPGITRILTGDALAGETERLHVRVAQLFDRFETQLKQVIREAEMREGLRPAIPLPAAANLLMATAEGRISQYVRSGFKRSPTEDWKQQWELLMTGFFNEAASQPVPGQGGFSQPLNQG